MASGHYSRRTPTTRQASTWRWRGYVLARERLHLNNTNLDPLDVSKEEFSVLEIIRDNPAFAFTILEERQFCPTWFGCERRALIYKILRRTFQDRKEIDTTVLLQALEAKPNDFNLGQADLERMAEAWAPKDNLGGYLDTILDRMKRRKALRENGDVAEALKNPGVALSTISTGMEAMAQDLCDSVNSLPAIRSAAELIANPPPIPPEVIHGVLRQGHKMVLAGTSKSCKTWSLMDLALCIGHGIQWLGIPTRRGRCLYLDFELGESALKERIEKIADAKGIAIEPGTLEFWCLRGYAADATTLLPDLGRKLAGKGYTAIFVDPIYKLTAGRDENSAGQMGEIMNALERLAKKLEVAIIFAHHFAKGDSSVKSSIDRMSGSGAFARDPDAIVTLTPHTTEDAYTVDTTLRHFLRMEPFVISWKWPLMERSVDLDPAQLKTAKGGGRPARYTERNVLDVLSVTGMTSKDLEEAVYQDSGMSRSKLFELMKAMREAKTIVVRDGKIHPNKRTSPVSPETVH